MKAGEFVLGGMFLVFMALKLAGVDPVASWSWWWVTAPLWGPLVVVAVCAVVGGFIYLCYRALRSARNWRAS